MTVNSSRNALKRRTWALFMFFFLPGLLMASWATRTPAIRDILSVSIAEMGGVLFGLSIGSMSGILCSALALGFVSLPLLAWIAQSPIIIITGEQLSSYEYGLLQVPIFGALIAGNLLLARLTSRRTVRSLIIMGGWPIMIGLLVAAAATVISSHAYLWMTAGLSIYAFGIGLANAGLVRLTLFASDMSKGTVSAAMGMLQMLIFTVGIEISKHAWLNGGNGLFNLFNLVNGILWLSLMVIFLKDKQMGNSHEG